MNVLAISYILPPNLYPQAIQIGRLLYNLSARVGAVCGKVSYMSTGLDCYPDFNKRLAFRLEVPFSPLLSGLVHRLACYGIPFYGRSPDEFKGWVSDAECATLDYLSTNEISPDVLVSFGEPMSDHLLGLRLKRHLQLPWIAHFSDPWSDNPFRRYFFLANYVNRRLEAQVIQHADCVIFTSLETLDLVMRKYPIAWRDKARVLPHSYEPNQYPQVTKRDGPLLIRYLGNFYGDRSPLPLFQAVAKLHLESPSILANIRIELIGSVPLRMLNSSVYRNLPKGIVNIVPAVPYSQSLRLTASADLLLVIDAPAKKRVFLPSKLVDYLGAGVPIVGIVPPGASASLISRLGGWIANPVRPQEVADTLKKAIEACWVHRASRSYCSWGVEEVRVEYHADRVAEKFLSIIKEVMI